MTNSFKNKPHNYKKKIETLQGCSFFLFETSAKTHPGRFIPAEDLVLKCM